MLPLFFLKVDHPLQRSVRSVPEQLLDSRQQFAVHVTGPAAGHLLLGLIDPYFPDAPAIAIHDHLCRASATRWIRANSGITTSAPIAGL
ncbi:hypothetical protein NE857_21260 [Nocardiopsis exhalans]|uniref:Uncharacterized protein n=1 Tax=Nocardiopsis exhalans TaxID=163604 RepID=A0ABY5D423_9ACTN|nr:hypothetical protein [Nocardiopsis exhalans]USY17846.1 hypothetical protein NE857_21260 [Nocardiopsis exhalans]